MALKTIHTDVAIIGAGTAGMVAYRAAIRAGKRAVLIESGEYGTTCARVGCMPSKLLIAASDAAHTARSSSSLGINITDVSINPELVMERVRNERDRFVSFTLSDIESFSPQDKLTGHASFISNNKLQVGNHSIINTHTSIIATGSTPNTDPNLAHLGSKVIFNDEVFYWQTLPKSILVVGSGVIGLELGQALTRLGVKTRIINRSASLGGLLDPDVRASATAAFKSELDLQLNTQISSAKLQDNQVHVNLSTGQSLVVDYILMAIGRSPNVSHLGLENTSAVFDSNSKLIINKSTLQLEPAPIFIAGDASGNQPILHEAADDGYIAGNNAVKYPNVSAGTRRAPIGIVFTDPQLAYVGLRNTELPDTGVVEGEVNFANQGRSRIILKNYGKLKVYALAEGGRFLGAEMAGPNMEHIAHLLAWAYQQDMTIPEMLAMPFYHPVVEEGLRTALRSAATQLQ